MAYYRKCLDLAQYFLGCEGDDGDDKQASLAQAIQDAVEAWFLSPGHQPRTGSDAKKRSASWPPAAGCRGTDDLCGCQNRPDAITRQARAALSQATGKE